MAIAAVWMAAALPAWRQQAQRQRELDLIFRGEQYARAVALYVMKNNCALPTSVDDLVSQHYLRKKWKDPITNDDFIMIPGAQPGQQGGGAPVQGGPGRNSAPTPGNTPTTGRQGGSAPSSNLGVPQGRSGGVPTTGSPFGPSSNQQQGGGGIAGVMSKSEGASIIVYNGQQTYNGWQFLYQTQLQKMGQTPQCNNGGQGGTGNQGGRNAGPGRNGQPGGPGVGPGLQPGRDGRPTGPGRGGPGTGRDGGAPPPPGTTIGRIGRGGGY